MKRSLLTVFSFIILLACQPLFAADSGAVFSPSEWNFGHISLNAHVEQKLTVENTGNDTLELSIVSTCDCLSPENTTISIKPKQTGSVLLKYNSESDTGMVKKFFIIRSNRKGLSKGLFSVYGEVGSAQTSIGKETAASNVLEPSVSKDGDIVLYYYYTPGCKKCEQFLRSTLPAIEKEMGKRIFIEKRDILDPKVFEEYQQKLTQLGAVGNAFPVLIYGNKIIQGNNEIEKNIRPFLADTNAGQRTPAQKGAQKVEILLIPVILAGLLDGINPCAFTTLIFLLSYLALAGRGRKEILVIGIFFTLSVFLTYYLIGLGFFHVLRAAQAVPLIGIIIKWVLVAVLVVFAVISLYDYSLIRRGREKDIVLQLPDAMKQRIHKSVRTYARSAALIGSAVVLGFFVSIFELACTGQIYFPTITYYIQVQKKMSLYFFLGVYNLCFIFPLLVVFVLTYAGVSSKSITAVFQKQMGPVKLGTAVLFVILAVLVLVF